MSTFFANIKGMSDIGLKAMQKSIVDCLERDDQLPKGQEKIYGVREFSDWRDMSNEIEAELDRRGIKYNKICW
ncbi:hypothetical protein [Herbaspirillum sp.]|uniref:hypothetical protein n=1 Tax=Herbaspirillum sp. TaxID=1890675 RepID=UPI001B0E0126|nr:hypothetical protein [Herbaspirillum sp.]MBO9535584.1 hypothetical protein [Herbaspirillum sp.]